MTKEQRKKVYQLALDMLNGEYEPKIDLRSSIWIVNQSGVCELIRIASIELSFLDYGKYIDDETFEITFTEFVSFKPQFVGLFWWPDYDREIRKHILKKCIEMCN